jgi:asparagine synthetase B (glutamine-hydrolysing)
MAKTVREEMPDEQRRDELIMGLSGTGSEEVFVNYSHLAQAVGEEAAGNLAQSLVESREVVNPNLSPRSTLRQTARRNAICQVPRAEALEACKEAKSKAAKSKIDAKIPVPKA